MRLMQSVGRLVLVLVIAAFGTANTALAHHLMDGETPSTFTQGLLSGLAHPIIGLDHLAFLVAVGVAVGVCGLNLLTPVLLIGASALGVALHVAGLPLPGAELLVAVSVFIAGLMLARRASIAPLAWGVLFGVAGLAHGYAFGESIFGAEPTPLSAYLIGLVIIQSALTSGIALLVRFNAEWAASMAPRLTGAMVAGVGLAIFAGHIVPA